MDLFPRTGSLQPATAPKADHMMMVDGAAMELVRDRRAPGAMLLLILLAGFMAMAAGIAWYGLGATDMDEGARQNAPAMQRISSARRAFERAPIIADPAHMPVAPMELRDLSRDEARQLNASIPFSTDPVPRAIPLVLPLSGMDSARATDCMAAALWYEAGDDPVGERAVAQVVLNRVRHPAFPNTVCGVVFQGSERQTGCQFSFTCDGAMRRTPSAAAWRRAREIATGAMAGLVFAPVGYATHYHTDWVAPYWSAKVDKIAQIGTHLFFRWTGGAGRPGAFTSRYAGGEPRIASLMPLSPAHGDAAVPTVAPLALPTGLPGADALARLAHAVEPGRAATEAAIPPAMLRGNRLVAYDERRNNYDVALAPAAPAGAMAVMALDLCARTAGRPCTVHGHAEASTSQTDIFYYYNDKARNYEILRWDCRRYERADPSQCMTGTITP